MIHPAADPTPLEQCDRCHAFAFVDIPIHGGASLRRQCSVCGRFMGWPKWGPDARALDAKPDPGRECPRKPAAPTLFGD